MASDSDLLHALGLLSISSPVGQAQQTQLIERSVLVQSVLLPSLDASKHSRLLQSHDSFFQRSRAIFEQVKVAANLTEQSFLNFQQLACGDLRMPVILLLNPTATQEQPHDRMVEVTRSLHYLHKIYFASLNLELKDVVVIDVYPFLTDDILRRMAVSERLHYVDLVFNITSDFFKTLRPEVVVSCQCQSGTQQDRFGAFDDPLAISLRSSMDGANRNLVKRLTFHGSTIHVVQAFHPSSFINYGTAEERKDLQRMWERILDDIYVPSKHWFRDRIVLPSAPKSRDMPASIPTSPSSLDARAVHTPNSNHSTGRLQQPITSIDEPPKFRVVRDIWTKELQEVSERLEACFRDQERLTKQREQLLSWLELLEKVS